MSELIYIDTNVFMDHFDGRVDKLRPLGEFAFQLLKKAVECKFDIIISTLVLKELIYNSYKNQIEILLPSLDEKGKIFRAEITQEDVEKARKICNERRTHYNDTLHAVIANKMRAKYLVTRNIRDFVELQDLVNVVFPENL